MKKACYKRHADQRRRRVSGNHKYLLIAFACFFCSITACSGFQPQVTVTPEINEKGISIKAESFRFEPNNIRAYEGDVLLLKVENVSGSTHNLTIEDPEGSIVQNVDLPSKMTVEVKVSLAKSGVYNFYCNKPFHPTLGMKGRIEVLKK